MALGDDARVRRGEPLERGVLDRLRNAAPLELEQASDLLECCGLVGNHGIGPVEQLRTNLGVGPDLVPEGTTEHHRVRLLAGELALVLDLLADVRDRIGERVIPVEAVRRRALGDRVGRRAGDEAEPRRVREERGRTTNLGVEQRLVGEHARDHRLGVRVDVRRGERGVVEVVRERPRIGGERGGVAIERARLGLRGLAANLHLVAVEIGHPPDRVEPGGLVHDQGTCELHRDEVGIALEPANRHTRLDGVDVETALEKVGHDRGPLSGSCGFVVGR